MKKLTRQRTAIEQVITQADRPLLPQEILEVAKKQVTDLGMATVYRNLKTMLEDGNLCAVELPGQNTRSELPDVTEPPHFQCLTCKQVFDIHSCLGDFASLAPPGFEVESHEITLYGRCAACKSKA